MKKSFCNNLLVSTIILIAASSCAKEIALDTQSRPAVVVECVLVDASVQTLRLSFTETTSQEQAPALEQAEAVLIDLTENSTVGSFVRQEEGVWTLDYTAKCEHSYRIEVKVPGYDLIYAEQKMPEECNIQSSFYSFSSSWSPPISADEFFRGTIYSNPGDTMWVYAMKYNPRSGKREIVEHLCTDAPYVDDFNFSGNYYNPPVSDYDVYGTPRDSSELYPNLRDYPLHRYALRFKMPREGAASVCFSGTFSGDYQNAPELGELLSNPADDEGALFFCKVSKDYERYLKEIVLLMGLYDSTDLADIFMRDNLYSNIEGGIGIFGAKSEKIQPWVYGYWKEGELCIR